LILLGVPLLGGYNYITPRRAGLSATSGLSCCVYRGRRYQKKDIFKQKHLNVTNTLQRWRPVG